MTVVFASRSPTGVHCASTLPSAPLSPGVRAAEPPATTVRAASASRADATSARRAPMDRSRICVSPLCRNPKAGRDGRLTLPQAQPMLCGMRRGRKGSLHRARVGLKTRGAGVCRPLVAVRRDELLRRSDRQERAPDDRGAVAVPDRTEVPRFAAARPLNVAVCVWMPTRRRRDAGDRRVAGAGRRRRHVKSVPVADGPLRREPVRRRRPASRPVAPVRSVTSSFESPSALCADQSGRRCRRTGRGRSPSG